MRADGLPSPNRGDALALSFAYPVTKKNRATEAATAGRRTPSKYLNESGDYDTQA